MGDQYRKLTREELEDLAGEPLPERAAMSLINANLAAPVNAAVAANVLSDDAVAVANAEQDATIDQSTGGDSPTEKVGGPLGGPEQQ